MVAAVIVVRSWILKRCAVRGPRLDVAGIPAVVLGRHRVDMLPIIHPANGRSKLDVDRPRFEAIVVSADGDRCGWRCRTWASCGVFGAGRRLVTVRPLAV